MPEQRTLRSTTRDVTLQILQARNIPPSKSIFKSKHRALALVTSGSYTRETTAVKTHNGTAEWNEMIQIPQEGGKPIRLTLVDDPPVKRRKHIATAEVSLESLRQGDPHDIPLHLIESGSDRSGAGLLPILLSISWSEPAHVVSTTESPPTVEVVPPCGTDPSTSDLDIAAQFDTAAKVVAATERAVVGMGLASATLVDALQATPGIIQSAQDTVDAWQPVLDQIKWVVDVVDGIAEIHPYVKVAWSVLSLIPKSIVNQAARDENVRQLLTTMKDAFDLAKDAETLTSLCETSSQRDILKNMLDQVSECGHFIRKYAGDPSFGKRLLKNVLGSTDSVLEQFSSTLVKLRLQFIDHATIVTEVTVFRILDDVRELSDELANHSRNNTLSRLPYAAGARFDPKKGCLSGTRTTVLDNITSWVNDPSAERMLVLFGQAGRGKSSIAHEIAKRFDAMGRLCTSFVFKRGNDREREPYRLFPTIARDLSHRCLSFAQSLATSMEGETAAWKSDSYDTLFEFFFDKQMKDLTFVGPLIVVIDALDESNDASALDGLHSFLATHLPKLPNNFRFFITSRPEPEIRSSFRTASSLRIMEIDNVEHTQDIKLYMEKTLSPSVFKTHGDELVSKSEGLFQWAAVVCAYINKPPRGLTSRDCVDDVLNAPGGLSPLDSIYTLILGQFDMNNECIRGRFKSVMGIILVAAEPISVAFLAAMRDVSDLEGAVETVKATLVSMGSLLSNVDSLTGPIAPLHSSFYDFLTDMRRSRQYYIDQEAAHCTLLTSSLSIMNECLIFNICKLETSYLPNTYIPNLETLIKEFIPLHLQYACRFWNTHLRGGDVKDHILRACDKFLKEKFLFWLEVLSLIKGVEMAPWALTTLATHLHGNKLDFEILDTLVRDALIFVRTNIDPIRESAPHIYLSALMFAPSSSAVYQQYKGWFPLLVSAFTHRQFEWSALMNLGNSDEHYSSVSLSSNGQVVATTSEFRWITLRDVATGDQIARMHLRSPYSLSVVASPDCYHVAIRHTHLSGLRVSIWDSSTGEMMTVMTTPTDDCYFAFSPDGSRLVTHDKAGKTLLFCVTSGKHLRQWIDDKVDVQRPFFVAYSSNEQIAICRGNRTIRVRAAETGQEVHVLDTSHITAMAFSHDGSRLAASWSTRHTFMVHLWDTRTWGRIEAIPVPVSTPIRQIAFSPDGESIAYFASDFTLRLLSIVQRKSLAGPEGVVSVAFSSNGRSLIAVSQFGRVYNWDMKANYSINRRDASNHPVHCVAFSPSGRYVAATGQIAHAYGVQSGVRIAGDLHEQQFVHKGIAFLPGDRIVSCSSQRLIVSSAETGHVDWQSELQAGDHFEGPLVASPDGRLIVTILYSGSTQGLYCVGWDADKGSRFTLFNLQSGGICTATSRADTWLPTGYSNGDQVDKVLYSPIIPQPSRFRAMRENCTVFVGNKRVLVGAFSDCDVQCAAFSTDAAVLMTVVEARVCLWDSSSGRLSGGPFKCITHFTSSIAFSPRGDRFATTSLDKIWVLDAKSFQLVAGPFRWDTGIRCVGFSHDGRYIATGTDEGVLCLWNIEPKQCRSDPGEITISDDSAIDQGWIRGPNSELILWVPPGLRKGFHRLSTVWVRGPGINEARVDFDKMPHGTRWTDCYSG